MNIKTIILSQEYYDENDLDNVLQCGQVNESDTTHLTDPDKYIILNYTGDHYELVKYSNKDSLAFDNLPNRVKELIINKCLETSGGPFSLIKHFNMKEETTANQTSVYSVHDDLYDDGTVFQFYNKSAGGPAPGKGNGEMLGSEGSAPYSALRNKSVGNWRRKLSNMWLMEPFLLDGNQWHSVEHYYQASKFKNTDPELYHMFTVESNSTLSKHPEEAKKKGEASKNSQDPRFFEGTHKTTLEKGLSAKFALDEYKDILKNTGRALLQEYIRKSPPMIGVELMNIRKNI